MVIGEGRGIVIGATNGIVKNKINQKWNYKPVIFYHRPKNTDSICRTHNSVENLFDKIIYVKQSYSRITTENK